MNNFNPTSLQQQQHVANVLQSSPTAPAISYLQQPQMLQQPQQQHQQLSHQLSAHHPQQLTAAAVYDPRALEKSYYTAGAATVAANAAATGRFFTTTGTAATAAHAPNTILITNNFAQQQLSAVHQQQQQQQQQQQRIVAGNFSTNNSNIRIVSAAPQRLQQHMYNSSSNILGNKDASANTLIQANADTLQLQQQFYQQHYAQQQQQQLAQHFAQQHVAAMQLQLPPAAAAAAQQYFMPPDAVAAAAAAAAATNTAKLLPNPLATATLTGRDEGTPTANVAGVSTAAPNSTSTVVLDRINICINNHYTDAAVAAAGATTTTTTSLSTTPTQQPSPIIPAIQHKAVVDSGSLGLLIDPYAATNSSSNESTQLVIDEPDSTTTTPHTPPTTPENTTNSPTSSTAVVQTTPPPRYIGGGGTTIDTLAPATAKHSFAAIAAQTIEKSTAIVSAISANTVKVHAASTEVAKMVVDPLPVVAIRPQPELISQAIVAAAALPLVVVAPLTPPTPPTPPPAFQIGDDVFVKRQEGRLYLGTVIYSACQRFLVRFDDKTEVWCNTGEMRKLGGSSGCADTGSGNVAAGVGGNAAAVSDPGPQCVACKRRTTLPGDVVEICERCGRGYHRMCTTETATGSGVWQCKRCAKPMKMLKTYNNNNANEESKANTVCRQLPYHVETLNWDKKHRVNEEQIYCYCGKSGKFDHMLQCCKCRNWYHTHCMQHFKSEVLRGDGFFVFCCSVCNDGREFMRRLQLNWVDLMHLTLYNLSAMKKHQHHKYHHLVKDIWPFVLEKRCTLPICKEWIDMPESEFMECIKNTLKDNTERFICGREIKRDHYYYALRNNGPPILPKFNVQNADVLCDELLIQNLKLNLLKGAPENESETQTATDDKSGGTHATTIITTPKSKPPDDIYEFRIEDDEKFTSDDEIPIKHIIEKVKKNKITPTTIDKVAIKTKSIIATVTTSTTSNAIEITDKNANAVPRSPSSSSSCTINKKSPQKHSEAKSPSSLSSSTSTTTPKKEAKVEEESAAQENPVVVSTAIAPAVKSSRKRKAFTLSYKEIAAEAAAKRYDGSCSRICDSSSDENSSSSRGTSLDLIIPPPKNFLGLNNPFLMVTPKKCAASDSGVGKKSVSFGRKGGGHGTFVKNSVYNTSTLDFSSKLAALKSAGMFPNLSTSNLAKAAGQQRTVRTIKRRLSAKDITIGPNQEVRRRRTRRLSSNIEVISTTTINPIPSNFFPIHAKDLFNTSATTTNHHKLMHQQNIRNQLPPIFSSTTPSSSASSSPPASTTSSLDSLPTTTPATTKSAPPTQAAATVEPAKPTHGRRLRQRPQKNSPNNSRRSSISGASTSSNQSATNSSSAAAVTHAALQAAAAAAAAAASQGTILLDLKQSVNKYFGAANRIESGEQFSIRAKRQLANGQMQYLIEWGETTTTTGTAAAIAT